MSDKIRAILINSILGDALCTAIDGFSRGKILSDYKEVTGYIEPALNRKTTDRWRKAGLYSSISQFMLISCFSLNDSGRKSDSFIKIIEKIIEQGSGKPSMFRHMGAVEKRFIKAVSDKTEAEKYFNLPCTRIIPVVFPLVLYGKRGDFNLLKTTEIIKKFTSDESTISGAMLILKFLARCIENSTTPESIISTAIEANESVSEYIKNNSHIIFEHQLNPEKLLAYSKSYNKILNEIKNETKKDKAEIKIIDNLNNYINNPVKRATVTHPLAIIPYALYIVRHFRENPKSILFNIVYEGGSTAPLASIAGAAAGAVYGAESISEALAENLINKKKILPLIGSISEKGLPLKMPDNFIKRETALSLKENEELNARLKLKKDIPKKKKRKDRENELTKHVVESWTKLDKAKWKKMKKNIDLYNKK